MIRFLPRLSGVSTGIALAHAMDLPAFIRAVQEGRQVAQGDLQGFGLIVHGDHHAGLKQPANLQGLVIIQGINAANRYQ